MTEIDPDDILVTIDHTWGELEVSLSEWIRKGPGVRPLLELCRARSRSTGEELPLAVVPLRYHNSDESRQLIAEGKLENPWPDN